MRFIRHLGPRWLDRASVRARMTSGLPALAVTALLSLLVVATCLPGPPARAQEQDSTTGTASTVSPSTVARGGTLRYTLSGFPVGAQVEVLLDDVDTQVLTNLVVGQDGTASGTLELPKLIGLGPHWLRFRTRTVEEGPGPGVPGSSTAPPGAGPVSNKSPFFTVGEVTVIGSSAGQRSPAASGLPDAATAPPVPVEEHGPGLPLALLLAAVLLSGGGGLAVVLLRRRRTPAGPESGRSPGAGER